MSTDQLNNLERAMGTVTGQLTMVIQGQNDMRGEIRELAETRIRPLEEDMATLKENKSARGNMQMITVSLVSSALAGSAVVALAHVL